MPAADSPALFIEKSISFDVVAKVTYINYDSHGVFSPKALAKSGAAGSLHDKVLSIRDTDLSDGMDWLRSNKHRQGENDVQRFTLVG